MHNSCESKGPDSRQIVQTMVRAVEKKHGELISAARKEWERRFAGSDPSDACVTVRISTNKSCGDLSLLFPIESRRTLSLS